MAISGGLQELNHFRESIRAAACSGEMQGMVPLDDGRVVDSSIGNNGTEFTGLKRWDTRGHYLSAFVSDVKKTRAVRKDRLLGQGKFSVNHTMEEMGDGQFHFHVFQRCNLIGQNGVS